MNIKALYQETGMASKVKLKNSDYHEMKFECMDTFVNQFIWNQSSLNYK